MYIFHRQLLIREPILDDKPYMPYLPTKNMCCNKCFCTISRLNTRELCPSKDAMIAILDDYDFSPKLKC